MSPRVLLASALLTALLAGSAIFFLFRSTPPDAGDPGLGASGAEWSHGSDRPGSAGSGGAGVGDGEPGAEGSRNSGGSRVSGSRNFPSGSTPGGAIPGASAVDGEGAGDARPGGAGRAGNSGNSGSPGGFGGSGERSGRDGPGGGETAAAAVAMSISIHGTIVAIDTEGGRHPEESGQLGLRVRAPGLDEIREVAVVSGAWSATVPERAELGFESATLGERPARVSPAQSVVAAAGSRFELIGQWTSQTMLHVRSRATGEALCDLELVRIPDWMRNSRPHPGVVTATDERRTAECSPFPLDSDGPAAGTSVPFHVRSPGFAWGRILLDTAVGGDREILLDAGGALDISFTGGWERPGALLRLRTLGETQPYAEVAVMGQTMRVEGVHPGQYEVSVETGSWAQSPKILGSAEVAVAAGELIPLAIDVAELEDTERVPLAGTAFIPSAWQLVEFQLRVRPVDPGTNQNEETQHIPSLEMTATLVSGGTLYAWEADPVEPGNFGVLVLPIGYGINVVVGPEGNLEAAIALPDPVPVEVVTVLAGTDEPALPGSIRWTPAREPGVPGAGALSVLPEAGTNVFIFDAPLGDLLISSSDVGYRPASRQVTATVEGPNVFTLELEPAHGIHVLLFDEETPVPWDLGWHANLTAMEGTTGVVVTRGRVGVGYRILVSSPGMYTLTVPEIDGFLPVAPQAVEVLEGQIIDVEIGLVREQ